MLDRTCTFQRALVLSWVVVALLAATGVTAPSASASGPAACGSPRQLSGSTFQVICAYTGGYQTFTPPTDVDSASFDVKGAQGGQEQSQPSGGLGGETISTLPVTPGTAIEVVVGGAGGAAEIPGSNNSSTGGFNGGGDTDMHFGPGGGGASDIRTGSCAATASCDLSARVVVAGGGGGTDAAPTTDGGNGSGQSGAAGGTDRSIANDGGGGAGATQSAGGTGGSSGGPGVQSGGDGTLGQGGSGGGPIPPANSCDGGGGGGGYFGGGGGGAGVAPYPKPSCSGGGGGGGSGYGPPGSTFNAGVQSGNGVVTITYTVLRSSSTSVRCVPTSVSVSNATTCTAQVTDTDQAPTGTVFFASDSSGSFSLGASCTLSAHGTGVAFCSVTYAPTAAGSGPHQITAAYRGDFRLGMSSGQTTVEVTGRRTSTAVSCSPESVTVNGASTCTATVSDTDTGTASAPTGTVSFGSGSPGGFSAGGSCMLTASSTSGTASCSVGYTPTALGSGTHTITASYGGDGSHEGSKGTSTLMVTTPPRITSASSAAFTIGQAGSFAVITTGSPAPGLSESGALPAGVSFTDNHDGTATLAGTPAAGSAGVYPVTITAANGSGSNATQQFTLTVEAPPAPTSGSTPGPGSTSTTTSTTTPSPRLALSPPTSTISAPRSGATFRLGQRVGTRFSCREGAHGPGLLSCSDSTGTHTTAGGRGHLNTSHHGRHTYTVTATSRNGRTATATVTYRVIDPAPRLSHLTLIPSTLRAGSRRARLTFQTSLPAPVTLTILRCAGHHHRCAALGRVHLFGHRGTDHVTLTGELTRLHLSPGRYTLRLHATADGTPSNTLTAALTILRPRRR